MSMDFRKSKSSSPDLRRKLTLSNLDVFHTIEVARTFLAVFNSQVASFPGAQIDTRFTDLNRVTILESIRDISCQFQNHFGGANCMRIYALRLVDMKVIRQMLFDYDVYLSMMYKDCPGEIPASIIECYDWSFHFRRRLNVKEYPK